MKLSKITSVKSLGVKDTYDLTMESKYHNFILNNGVVASNCHAAAYSFITAQTLYLSYYYPVFLYAAGLSIDAGNVDDVRNYIRGFRERGFEILPPSINNSDADFKVVGENIVFGLSAVKGVGSGVTKKIMSRRPKSRYKSFGHFVERNLDLLNSKIIEFYTKAGCFTEFGINKTSILESLPDILNFCSIQKAYTRESIFNYIDISLADYIDNVLIKRIDKKDPLEYEIESLGFYISEHPTEIYTSKEGVSRELREINSLEGGTVIVTYGCLSSIQVRKTKLKQNMCSFNLESYDTSIPCTIFPNNYSKYLMDIEEGRLVAVKAKINESESKRELVVFDIYISVGLYTEKIYKKRKNNDNWLLPSKIIHSKMDNILHCMINDKLKYILEKV